MTDRIGHPPTVAGARRRSIIWVLAVSWAAPALAWHPSGHWLAGEAAARSLAGRVPDFFVEQAEIVGSICRDPDLMRDRAAPQLRVRVAPDHYINLERLGGAPLPETRYAYLALLADLDLEAMDGGLLPYAVIEGTQRLALAFAEYRQRPDEAARAKALVYAGLLGHHAQDLCQPLHTTVHHNGRALEGLSSPRTGIHHLVDGLAARAVGDLAALPAPQPLDDLMVGVLEEMEKSHALVDRVYRLEPELERLGQEEVLSGELGEFARERLRAAIQFTAGLYLTAWELSAAIELPDWLLEAGESSSRRPSEAGPSSYPSGDWRW